MFRSPTPRKSIVVMEHLDKLAGDVSMDPVVRSTSHQLFFEWQRFAESMFGGANEDDASALMRDTIRKAMSS